MSVGGVINICYRILMCLVSESTSFSVTILGTLVGALILDALLLYGIHNVSSYYFMQFYWILHQGWILDI
jgi:predicted ABC-type sugar transport system permease subunit